LQAYVKKRQWAQSDPVVKIYMVDDGDVADGFVDAPH
jgi:hypothetical protein